MRIENRYHLPEAYVRAVSYDDYEPAGDISVTTLAQPAQIIELRRRHEDEITIDASELSYVLMGKAVHYALAAARADNALVEERLTIDMVGWTIGGKPDLYEGGGPLTDGNILSDWKLTSAWSFVFAPKLEWLAQLNMYAYLLAEYGFPVKKIQAVGILRDWQKARRNDHGYPRRPVLARPFPLWPFEHTRKYMEARVKEHRKARDKGKWPPCSDNDRWMRNEQWAVMPGHPPAKPRARAIAVFGPGSARKGGELEANAFVETLRHQHKPSHVQHRPGVNTRCAEYCPVAPFCDQWVELKPKRTAAPKVRTVTLEEATQILETPRRKR
ncbi:MAG TPA: hypothetical protein VGB13_10680 [Candidatus Krumholzibacteria bacterium]